ncbi:MAG TPA: helix-turn-helix transcriptional regulator [Fimbriimonadaceae bacterium]|nr:helix-turn-helix transcriptional regulator [Fimbriimonadaceae bacterium]
MPTSSEKRFLASFGAAVRSRREKLGVSQEGLALTAELDRTYVGGVERGERNLGLINVGRLAAALETTPADLLSGLVLGDK